MSQLQAGIQKDCKELFKTFRIYIFGLGFVLFAVIDPFMMSFLPKLMELMGMDAAALTGGQSSAQALGLAAFAGDCLQMGLLAMLLAMMRAAGGDQKDHSCVIPLCAGYRRETYIYSKFCVYPVLAFVFGFISYWLAYGVSYPLFEVKLPVLSALPLSLALGAFMAFSASLMLLIGCATGRAGISAVVIFFAFTILNMVLPLLKLNQFCPFALPSVLTSAPEQIENPASFWTGIATAAALCLILALVTARLFKRKKIV